MPPHLIIAVQKGKLHMQRRTYQPEGTIASTYQASYTRLLALFGGELLALKWIGARIKRAHQHKRLAWEKDIRHFAEQRLRSYHAFLKAVSSINQILPVLDIVVWCCLRLAKRRDAARFWLQALGGVAILRRSAKWWVDRRRPAVWDRVFPTHTPSFPSGHACDTMALFLALLCLTWRTAWRTFAVSVGTPIILLVGLARIALDKHYPTDVLAGWLTAGVWILGIRKAQRPTTPQRRDASANS